MSEKTNNDAAKATENTLRLSREEVTALLLQHSPQFIEQKIHEYGIIGQNEAVKTAAMILYKRLAGLPSTSLFVGPTGCGKTEIWRAVNRFCEEYYYGYCKISLTDGSQITPEGWKGNVKIRDIVVDLLIEDRPTILIIDEFDKLIEPVHFNGTSITDIIQNEFLKITDGDLLTIGADKYGEIPIDFSKLSVVFIGAFQRLLEGKSKKIRLAWIRRSACAYIRLWQQRDNDRRPYRVWYA